MDTLSIFMTALALAMDAFSVAVANGLAIKKIKFSHVMKFGLFFGAFQFIMPVLGWFGGTMFSRYIVSFDHWVAFGLLSMCGGKMLFECFKNDGGEEKKDEAQILKLSNMILLAIATSIDALAVGVSFAVTGTDIALPAAIIGTVAFILSAAGVFLGKTLGKYLGKKVEIFGGCVLILIGFKILIDHLFFS